MKNKEKYYITEPKLYNIYLYIKASCYNKNHNAKYKYYGARGITMHDEWKNDTSKFIEWAHNNGYKEGLCLIRKDRNGNFEPSNCKFGTRKEAQQHKITTLMIGDLCLKDYWKKNNINMSYSWFWKQVKAGNYKYE